MNSWASRFGGDHSIARRVAQFWSSSRSLAQPGLNSQISVSKSVAAPAAWFLSLFVTSSCFLSSGLSYAQSPADDFSRRQEQQEQLQRLENLKQVTPDSVISRADRAPRGDATSTGPCFDISRVEIEGATRLSAATLGTLTRPFNDRCVGVADITTLLKAITDLYLDKGFVTSRSSEWKSKVEPDRVRSSDHLRREAMPLAADWRGVHAPASIAGTTHVTAFPAWTASFRRARHKKINAQIANVRIVWLGSPLPTSAPS